MHDALLRVVDVEQPDAPFAAAAAQAVDVHLAPLGIAAGAYFAGERHLLLMQNHGFLASINGVVSLAQLYGIPLCMLIALRGHWGEPYPWHTRGGIVTEGVLRALGIPFEYARDPATVGRQIREAYTFSQSSLSPVALLLTRDLMED